ncbi:RNA polymerase sigma-54 factor [Vannielia sp.]|uniref:RNA polymerase factor sigma-54 n=1 Tax=Vannielia sp. TaxID=2813045 RepID=UPI002634A5DD|nr:RNA polymerase sigma-54 factor [Vannielia sp.]MDF1873479.1 RNA polymerase sigma-54 factor [Vannielia sp.]
MSEPRNGPGTRLELRQTQRLGLTPGLQQSFSLLSMPCGDLEEFLVDLAEQNPVLQFSPRTAGPDGASGTQSAYDVAVQTVASRTSLGEHLSRQVALMSLPREVAHLAGTLAFNLDESGFVPEGGIVGVAREYDASNSVARQAVLALQACDPTGIGALSLTECLSLQLAEQGLDPTLAPLVINHLPRFLRDEPAALGLAIGISPDMVKKIAAMARMLDPAPARAFDLPEPTARVPELSITATEDGALRVELINDLTPRLSLDRDLLAAREAIAGGSVAKAEAVLRAIRFRGKTLLRIGRAIVQKQAAYFSGHSTALSPLTRTAIADELGLHKSTVGRAVDGKTLLWNGRILELSGLFPSRLGPPYGRITSSHDARARIARLITAETADTVLSDARLMDMLKDEGVDISRRTVAKYRQCLNIPPSSERRRLLARTAARRGVD